MFFNFLKKYLKIICRPLGRDAFLYSFGSNEFSLLDVGCGKSPDRIKSLFPNIYYTGLDINCHYNDSLADKMIITTKDNFINQIYNFNCSFDAIICAHNLEHVDDRDKLLVSIIHALKNDGLLYLSFPSSASVNFPNREVTLNYYDDPTHLQSPPNLDSVINFLEQNGLKILYSSNQYQPTLLRLLGFILEPLSRILNRCLPGTFEYFGFEALIWAKKSIK